MDKSTLQALRRQLFFSRKEAAQWIAAGPDRPAGVTDRSWRMWEDGSRSIPDDVSRNIAQLVAYRANSIKAIGKVSAVVWYDSLQDWLTLPGNKAIYWRPQQSVCAEILAIHPSSRLVPFDRSAFVAWRAVHAPQEADSDAIRTDWAAAI